MSVTMGDEEGKVLCAPKSSSALSFVATSTLDLPVTPWRIPVPVDPNHVYSISSFPPLSTFDIVVEHAAIIIPVRRTAELRNTLKHILLRRPKMTNVYPLGETDPIPAATSTTTTSSNHIPPPRSLYRKLVLADRKEDYNYDHDPSLKALLESGECCQGTQTLTAGYSDWTLDEVLSKLLPVDGNVPSSFESIGHLAHINLREELLPYKYLIGKVLLDKNTPRIQTVVNKIGNIETEYRTFGMEVIAGKDETGWSNVTVKEDGCQYDLDFRKVYWNSRLGGEHRRLVALIRKDAATKRVSSSPPAAPMVVADLMAGIGPFAVPLTSSNFHNNKKEAAVTIQVHGNDLNPQSFKYLKINAKANNCKSLTCYNMDARAFCHSLQDQGIDFHHVLMNLPASAPEFLDAFRGFKGTTLPRIHVHCFGSKQAPPKEAEQECIDRCSKALGCSLDEKQHSVTVHTVRDVSPKKNMYCVSFTLPEEARDLPRIVVLPRTTNPGTNNEDDKTSAGPQPKRTKL
jgi:tRNA (guanine37-N1)-methyltransferase